jgi:DNA-binding transcriptional LysR family regulator
VFREQAAYSADLKQRLAAARGQGAEALRAGERDLGALEDVAAGVLVDLLLSYRAGQEPEDLIRRVEARPEPVRHVGALWRRTSARGKAIEAVCDVIAEFAGKQVAA